MGEKILEKCEIKMTFSDKIVKVLVIVGLTLLLWVGYSQRVENIQFPQGNSYFEVLQDLVQQIKGDSPLQTLYGNMHGAVYPISLAYMAKIFGIESEKIVFYVQGVIVIGAIIFCGVVIWYWRKKFWMGIVSILCLWSLCREYLLYDFNYSYWGGGAIALMAMPLLCDLFVHIKDSRRKKNIVELLILVFIMIMGNIIRQHASLPILVILLIYMCFKIKFLKLAKEKITLVFSLFIIVLLFWGAEPFIHTLYNGVSGKLDIQNVERPWHGLWCGLGYIENPYGFQWSDFEALEYAKSVDSTVLFCSEEYFDILKDRVLEVVYTDPMFVVSVYWKKFVDSLTMGWLIFGKKLCASIFFGLISFMLLLKRRISETDLCWASIIGMLVICLGTVQCVIGIPYDRYMYTSYAGYAYLITIFLIEILEHCWIFVGDVFEQRKKNGSKK